MILLLEPSDIKESFKRKSVAKLEISDFNIPIRFISLLDEIVAIGPVLQLVLKSRNLNDINVIKMR